MPHRVEIAEERKNQIMKATLDCIIEYGYHNFSMADIAKKANISKGIIHYYFLNKEELMLKFLRVLLYTFLPNPKRRRRSK